MKTMVSALRMLFAMICLANFVYCSNGETQWVLIHERIPHAKVEPNFVSLMYEEMTYLCSQLSATNSEFPVVLNAIFGASDSSYGLAMEFFEEDKDKILHAKKVFETYVMLRCMGISPKKSLQVASHVFAKKTIQIENEKDKLFFDEIEKSNIYIATGDLVKVKGLEAISVIFPDTVYVIPDVEVSIVFYLSKMNAGFYLHRISISSCELDNNLRKKVLLFTKNKAGANAENIIKKRFAELGRKWMPLKELNPFLME